jgi:hypothetical protein
MGAGKPSSRRGVRTAWVVTIAVVAIAVAGGAAFAGVRAVGSGVTGKVDFATSEVRLETPSSAWQKVTTMNVTTAAGPLVVRFDAQAYVDDFNSGGVFDGRHYAATLVRVLVDGAKLSPSGVRFTTNEGKRNIRDFNGQSASFSWAGTVGAGGHTVEIDFRSLTKYDISGFQRWTLTADHG